jgi:hypothetical protein
MSAFMCPTDQEWEEKDPLDRGRSLCKAIVNAGMASGLRCLKLRVLVGQQ